MASTQPRFQTAFWDCYMKVISCLNPMSYCSYNMARCKQIPAKWPLKQSVTRSKLVTNQWCYKVDGPANVMYYKMTLDSGSTGALGIPYAHSEREVSTGIWTITTKICANVHSWTSLRTLTQDPNKTTPSMVLAILAVTGLLSPAQTRSGTRWPITIKLLSHELCYAGPLMWSQKQYRQEKTW